MKTNFKIDRGGSRKSRSNGPSRSGERGITMVLVAASMVAIVAMAALSIDAVTLYLANTEAQRSADAAALSAAKVLSLTGVTGDPSNSASKWQQACTLATGVATAVTKQNTMNGQAGIVTVTFPNNADTANCTGTDAAFGVNPLVTVKVQRTNLPTFFARIWGRQSATVSATATAEAFNPSNSGNAGNGGGTSIIPVQPRCVKPWLVPNVDPGTKPGAFVDITDGHIKVGGIRVSNVAPGEVGETFSLFADCGNGAKCANPPDANPTANVAVGSYGGNPPPAGKNLEYLPGLVPATNVAYPACAAADDYQKAVAGCDQSTVYQCGAPLANSVNLDEDNPGKSSGDTAVAAECLINQASGQDALDTTVYPFQIKAGSGNPLGVANAVITNSPSVVSLPIYDSSTITFNGNGTVPVTIVGFLQVFINIVDTGNGSVNITVLNVAGCGNGTGATGAPVGGSSPVPVRLITPP